MKLEARFVASATAAAHWPQWDLREVAIAGRSNVGKSSFINALTGVKDLARTSSTPGRTRSINFFEFVLSGGRDRNEIAIVDLPGFGYAKMSKSEAQQVAAAMGEYLEMRDNLAGLALLIDCRRQPEAEERQLAAALSSRGRQIIVVGTKCDKLKRNERRAATARLAALGSEPIMVSAVTGEGIDEVRKRIFGAAAS